MKTKLKMALSLILSAIVIFSSIAIGGMFANADTSTGKAIQLVKDGAAANITGGQASNIYFGTYEQSKNEDGTYNTDPIKWRVLANNTSSKQLFLLSDQALDTVQYHTEYEAVTWEKSTIRSWLNGYGAAYNNGGNSGTDYSNNNFKDTAFSADEQTAIMLTKGVVNNDNTYDGNNTDGGENTDDKIFLLSIDEAENSSYFSSNDARKCVPTDYAINKGAYTDSSYTVDGKATCWWWLRSPGGSSSYAAYVLRGGDVRYSGNYVRYGLSCVRPAFNLNLESVIFTSAAEGGKKSATGALSKIADYAGNDWKVTLKDADREFKVTESNASGKPGETITLSYSGATIYNKDSAPNEYISYIITDSNNDALYYGRVMQPTVESGQVSITIPTDLAEGKYTLNVFSEQYNGGENDDTKLTDYASEFSTIKLTVCNHKFDTNGKCTVCNIQKIANPTANENLTYTGEVQTGVNAGTGYTLTNNTGTNAGSYTATATISDGYIWSDETTSSKNISWSIAQKEITPTVNIEKETYAYSKEEIKPTVTVSYDGETINADEYDITYSNNIELGNATLTVKSKETGNYKFSTTKNFTITKADPDYDKTLNFEGVYGLALSTIDLPKGWSWVDSATVMNTMGNQEYSAKYTPTDTDHYNEITVSLPVTVKEHEHKWSSEWSHDETYHWHECTADGTCTITDNAKKGGYAAHNGGKATCTEDGFCADCKVKYLDATGHDFSKLIKTNKATFFKDGSKVYHCTHDGCNETRTEITLSTINRILAWFKNIFSFKF